MVSDVLNDVKHHFVQYHFSKKFAGGREQTDWTIVIGLGMFQTWFNLDDDIFE